MPQASPLTPAPHKGSLLVIFLAVFIDLLGFGMVVPLLPMYARDFGTDQSGWQIALLMASFSAMQFIFAPVWGRLSDRIGRRPVLMVGLAGSVLFYTLFGVATIWRSLFWLYVSRIGAGIAGATITTAQAYIADTTTLENRAKGMTLVGAAFGLGFAIGPLLGGFALPAEPDEQPAQIVSRVSSEMPAAEVAPEPIDNPGPGPGYLAAALSAFALVLAYFKLPESLNRASASAARHPFDYRALQDALRTPSVGPLLVTIFICVLAFATFETTLALLLKRGAVEGSPFAFSPREVLKTFAFIGATLAITQGFIVRRLAGRVPEVVMAAIGASLDILGFSVLIAAVTMKSKWELFAALLLMVCGLAMMMPSLNSLLSRRSDPAKQGGILGISQSMGALARILGPMLGVPMLCQKVFLPLVLPYVVSIGMMMVGLVMISMSARGGGDYGAALQPSVPLVE